MYSVRFVCSVRSVCPSTRAFAHRPTVGSLAAREQERVIGYFGKIQVGFEFPLRTLPRDITSLDHVLAEL